MNKKIILSFIIAILAISVPSQAMLKRVVTTVKTAQRSLYTSQVLKAFEQTHTTTSPRTVVALAKRYSFRSEKILWPYAATALAAATVGTISAEKKAEEEKSEKVIWLPESNISLHCCIIQEDEVTQDDIQLLVKAFAYRDFKFSLNDFKECTCVRACILTPEGPVLAAIALYRPDKNYPPTIQIDWLATHPNHQKKGVGNALINYIAQSTQAATIRLQATKEAYAFYLHAGFKGIGNICCYAEKRFR